MRSTDIVVGFDPGLAITGYGIIQGDVILEYGALRTPAKTALGQRLVLLYNQLTELLDKYKIARAGCEKLFFARNVTTALDVGHARGVILLALAQRHIPLLELTPLQVKHSLTGYGRADKQQIQYMVKSIFKLSKAPKPDDAADALAIALTTQRYATLD
ncbi:MAG: crossover junction endodeoxyribonuclease RuvC [Candidatus Kerfeldbacteria bacterium]|nr:crossover junction endodeoxyribonuclease RuvC [Candidatus Kerfeldbacteria bacterium]